MKVELLQITPNAEQHIERCTRICYNSENKTTDDSYKTFLPKTLKHGHFSALSHAFASFYIVEISRACSHQLVRHAHLRYLQRSQRYCEEKAVKFIIPPKLHVGKALGSYVDQMDTAWRTYDVLREAEGKKEDARYVLPNACTTEMVVSGTFQGWWDFLRIRLSKRTQWELRQVAQEIYKILHEHCPHIFDPELLVIQPELRLDFPE